MWHTQTCRFPEGDHWDVEAGGFLSRNEYVSEEGLRMEYGPLFAYMYRRFGPPEEGSDDHKEIACWYLTTPDPDVILWVSPVPSGALHSFGYGINADRFNDRRNEQQKQAFIQAIQVAIYDLLAPTNVRDVYINALGVVPDKDVKRPVKPFKYAGVGVDHAQLKALCD